ncbi:MAG: carboxypeptidase-like regulatory domain-containing protein [Parcubacteria group bacterium]
MGEVCQLTPLSVLVPAIPDVALRSLFGYWLNPAGLLLALGNLGLAVPLANSLRLIQAAFTQPGLLFFRRKRHGYGQVFESLSKRPIDLALVRIIETSTNRVVATRVTDSAGRFLALLPAGQYRFAVRKQGYDFPSRLLAGERFDPNVGPIYTGGTVEHRSDGPLEVNLPIDGPEDNVSVAQALRRQTRRTIHAGLAYGGLTLGAVSTIVAWTWQAWAIFAAHVILFLIFERLTYRPYGRPWGSVHDQVTGYPLGRSVVRILDTRFNRVLETVVADREGQYSFIVGANVYRLFGDRSAYEPYRGQPFKVRQRNGTVAQDITMRPGEAPLAYHSPARL